MLNYDGNYLAMENTWQVDLSNVDFITMKENWDDGSQHIKLHIGTKEVRLVCNTKKEVEELMTKWKNARNKNEYNKQTR